MCMINLKIKDPLYQDDCYWMENWSFNDQCVSFWSHGFFFWSFTLLPAIDVSAVYTFVDVFVCLFNLLFISILFIYHVQNTNRWARKRIEQLHTWRDCREIFQSPRERKSLEEDMRTSRQTRNTPTPYQHKECTWEQPCPGSRRQPTGTDVVARTKEGQGNSLQPRYTTNFHLRRGCACVCAWTHCAQCYTCVAPVLCVGEWVGARNTVVLCFVFVTVVLSVSLRAQVRVPSRACFSRQRRSKIHAVALPSCAPALLPQRGLGTQVALAAALLTLPPHPVPARERVPQFVTLIALCLGLVSLLCSLRGPTPGSALRTRHVHLFVSGMRCRHPVTAAWGARHTLFVLRRSSRPA